MPEVTPYLIFDGNCAEAMDSYQKILGGELKVVKVKETPAAEHTPPEFGDRLMHARLEIHGGAIILASDDMEHGKYTGIQNAFVSLSYKTADEARRIYDALCEGGNPLMPFSKTFWADGFGMLVDRFGARWMVGGGHSAAG